MTTSLCISYMVDTKQQDKRRGCRLRERILGASVGWQKNIQQPELKI
jgi:hypothetical protein